MQSSLLLPKVHSSALECIWVHTTNRLILPVKFHHIANEVNIQMQNFLSPCQSVRYQQLMSYCQISAGTLIGFQPHRFFSAPPLFFLYKHEVLLDFKTKMRWLYWKSNLDLCILKWELRNRTISPDVKDFLSIFFSAYFSKVKDFKKP